MEIRILIEGGGDGKDTKKFLRQGLHTFVKLFIDQARSRKVEVNLVMCGSRGDAFADFKSSLEQHPNAKSILVVDSESAVSSMPWIHLRNRPGDGWEKPNGVTDEQCHFMVQCMESWFIADPDSLEEFYGQGFQKTALPNAKNVETVEKDRVLACLKSATRNAKTKGEYHKTRHAPDLLKVINPEVVQSRAPHCKRLFETLTKLVTTTD